MVLPRHHPRSGGGGGGGGGGGASRVRWALGLALVVAAVWAVAGVVVLQRSGRHVHHEVAAQARSLSHWLDTRYRGGLLCSAAAHGGLLLPPPPPLVDAVASLLVNPSFSRQLAGWTSDGRSSVAVEQRSVDLNATAGHADSIVVDNHYWLASGGPVTADAAERPALPLACVWQDVSVRVLQRAAPSLNLVELLDAGRLMASASALLRRPTTDLGNWAVHRCAFRNRYCNAFFDDHVWLELAFLAGEGDEHDELRWTRDRSRAAADEAQAQALGLDAATASKTQQQQPVMTTATDAIILASAANSADTRGRVVESAAASAAELEQLGSVRSTIEEHVEWPYRLVRAPCVCRCARSTERTSRTAAWPTSSRCSCCVCRQRRRSRAPGASSRCCAPPARTASSAPWPSCGRPATACASARCAGAGAPSAWCSPLRRRRSPRSTTATSSTRASSRSSRCCPPPPRHCMTRPMLAASLCTTRSTVAPSIARPNRTASTCAAQTTPTTT